MTESLAGGDFCVVCLKISAQHLRKLAWMTRQDKAEAKAVGAAQRKSKKVAGLNDSFLSKPCLRNARASLLFADIAGRDDYLP